MSNRNDASSAKLETAIPHPYLFDEFSRLTHVAVCSPRRFAPGQAINLFQQASYASAPARREVLEGQHGGFRAALIQHGVKVFEIEPVAILPYQMFTRDVCFCIGDLGVRANLRFDIRQPEADLTSQTLGGVPWQRLEDDALVEGGDIIVAEPYVIVGLGQRTNVAAVNALRRRLDPGRWSVLTIELAPSTLHLDTALGLLRNTVVVESSALAAPLPDELRSRYEVVEVDVAERGSLASNFLAVDEQTVLMNQEHEILAHRLSKLGFRCVPLCSSEFLKLGGGFHCLTLPIRRCSNHEANPRV